MARVINSKDTVLIDFSAIWCESCKILTPIVDQLSTEMEGRAKVFKVDVDKIVGFQTKETLKSKLEKYLNK